MFMFSLGGQNLVTGWAVEITGWVSAHPVNMLAEALAERAPEAHLRAPLPVIFR